MLSAFAIRKFELKKETVMLDLMLNLLSFSLLLSSWSPSYFTEILIKLDDLDDWLSFITFAPALFCFFTEIHY